jgi:hypothetical protein
MTSHLKFGLLALFTAILLASVSGYFSVVGLSSLFAAAFIPVVIMGSSMEFAKLAATAWLHHNWNDSPRALKYYLTTAVIVLMLVTSMGIFGFLSKGHMAQEAPLAKIEINIAQLDDQIKQQQDIINLKKEQIANAKVQATQLNTIVDNKLSRDDNTAANLRQQQRKERTKIDETITQVTQEIIKIQETISELEMKKSEIQIKASEVHADLGPVKYVAELWNDIFPNKDGSKVSTGTAIRIVIVMIMLVFDPVAVVLVIAALVSFDKHRVEWARIVKERTVEAKRTKEEQEEAELNRIKLEKYNQAQEEQARLLAERQREEHEKSLKEKEFELEKLKILENIAEKERILAKEKEEQERLLRKEELEREIYNSKLELAAKEEQIRKEREALREDREWKFKEEQLEIERMKIKERISSSEHDLQEEHLRLREMQEMERLVGLNRVTQHNPIQQFISEQPTLITTQMETKNDTQPIENNTITTSDDIQEGVEREFENVDGIVNDIGTINIGSDEDVSPMDNKITNDTQDENEDTQVENQIINEVKNIQSEVVDIETRFDDETSLEDAINDETLHTIEQIEEEINEQQVVDENDIQGDDDNDIIDQINQSIQNQEIDPTDDAAILQKFNELLAEKQTKQTISEEVVEETISEDVEEIEESTATIEENEDDVTVTMMDDGDEDELTDEEIEDMSIETLGEDLDLIEDVNEVDTAPKPFNKFGLQLSEMMTHAALKSQTDDNGVVEENSKKIEPVEPKNLDEKVAWEEIGRQDNAIDWDDKDLVDHESDDEESDLGRVVPQGGENQTQSKPEPVEEPTQKEVDLKTMLKNNPELIHEFREILMENINNMTTEETQEVEDILADPDIQEKFEQDEQNESIENKGQTRSWI